MFCRAFLLSKANNVCAGTRILLPAITPRTNLSTPATIMSAELAEKRKNLAELMKEELPVPYEGPERDLVNFPRRKRPVYPDKVRMAFIPEEWFQFFYKKTGVTGPYLFGLGFITFMVSKEWYVIEHEFSTGCSIVFLAYMANKYFGPAARQWRDGLVEKSQKSYYGKKEKAMEDLKNNIATEKKNVWYMEGQRMLMDAKRENVQMQLETEYRKRLMNVYQETKKRLDFHMDYYNTRRKLEQKHMVDWIVNNVVKSITPQQEKEALQKCIEDLKFLSAQAK